MNAMVNYLTGSANQNLMNQNFTDSDYLGKSSSESIDGSAFVS